MDNLEQLQVVVNEVQSARQQVLALHQQMGGVLVEVSDRPHLIKELEETLVALKGHLERFTEREAELLATYNQLKQMLAGTENA